MIFVAFFSGATMMGCLTVAFFFARFWLKTNDRLFGTFSVSFLLLAIERGFALFDEVGNDESIYVIRMSAFILLILAVVDKNRKDRRV